MSLIKSPENEYYADADQEKQRKKRFASTNNRVSPGVVSPSNLNLTENAAKSNKKSNGDDPSTCKSNL